MNVKLKKTSHGNQSKSGYGLLGPDYPALDVPLDIALAYVVNEDGKPRVLEGYEIECDPEVAALFGIEPQEHKKTNRKKKDITEEGDTNG